MKEGQTIYKYKRPKRVFAITIIHVAVLSALSVLIGFLYAGGYFSAWFISIVIAFMALMALSIPRRITLDDEFLTILCLLEIVDIPTSEIVSVRRVDSSESRWMIPILGSKGFFGYFGYYLDLSSFDRVRFYATDWNNLIEIVDIYDDRYYVSCRNTNEFIKHIEQYIEQERPE